MKLLCIGDSNTYGYDPRSYLGSRYPASVRWTGRLEAWEIVNCGVNGLCIPQDGKNYVNLIRSRSPDLVAVMLGSNDLLEGLDAEKTAKRMDDFLASLSEAGAPILLIAPPPMCPGEWVRSAELIAESEKLAACYRALAGNRGVFFADAGAWHVELTFDGVHFSPTGHAAFAEGLRKTLLKLL